MDLNLAIVIPKNLVALGEIVISALSPVINKSALPLLGL